MQLCFDGMFIMKKILSIFLVIKNYLMITIQWDGTSKACLHSIGIGYFKYIKKVYVNQKDSISLSDFSGSNKLSISFSLDACDHKDEHSTRIYSCNLDRIGSDFCYIYVHDTGIDCSECYK